MRWVFWSAFALVAYTYAGYLCWLWLRARLFPWPVRHSPQEPQVSVVMVVRNEEQVLQRKLQNILTLDYPEGLCQVVVVSDGSTDGTERILSSHAADPRVHVIMNQLPRGKASGLNDAIAMASGEIIVFTDARQQIEPGAIRLLAENFTDPEVGCVSGALMLGDPGAGETGKGMGLYWGIEKKIRELESAAGSVVGATGAIYSVRREFLSSVPEGTILDDVYIPMQVARQGKRIVFEDRARAWDTPDLGKGREFARKVRTLSGNYQLLQLAPWLLTGEPGALRIREPQTAPVGRPLCATDSADHLRVFARAFFQECARAAVGILRVGFAGLAEAESRTLGKHGRCRTHVCDAEWRGRHGFREFYDWTQSRLDGLTAPKSASGLGKVTVREEGGE